MPPELLSDALAEPTVMRSFACCTVRVPRPETAKRRKACLVGELSAHSEVAVPKLPDGVLEST